MNYTQLVQRLPTLNDRASTDFPQFDRFAAIVQQGGGRTSAQVLQLLNRAISALEPGEIYCEIGCGAGANLIGALLDQGDRLAYGVDNLSDRDPSGQLLEQLGQNLAAFGLEEQVFCCDQDFEAFFQDLRQLESTEKIGIYFYNGPHDYRSQILALLLVKPFLADRSLILLGESHWDSVQQAVGDFIAAHPQCKLLLNLPTPEIVHPSDSIQILSWNIHETDRADWDTIAQLRKPELIVAIANLEDWKFLYQQAQALQLAGQFAEARQRYLNLLEQQSDRAEIWHGLGQVLENLKDIIGAASAYQKAIALNPKDLEAHNSLGNLVAKNGDPDQAVLIYQQAIAIAPKDLGTHLNLGNILLIQGQAEFAIATYEAALAIDPQNLDVLHNLEFAHNLAEDEAEVHLFAGTQLYQRQRYAEALAHLQFLVDSAIAEGWVYEALADCYEREKHVEAAIATAQLGVYRAPTASLQTQLIRLLVEAGQTEWALTQAVQASDQFPANGWLRLKKHLLLPILNQTIAEIPAYRDRYTQGLTKLVQELSPDSEQAIAAIANHTNFFLGYQAQNDRDLQQQYGDWVHQVMAAHYPQWVQPLTMPAVTDKIRVGYVSGCLHDHTVGKLIIGWFRHHDRDRFQIYSYQVFSADSALTEEFRQHSDAFYSIPNDLAAVCQQIRADRPHILVFPEIGMQPLMTQLAALRLAPVQCSTWLHPISSGLPTVDYFLSSDRMEPENAQEHYTEQLIRLPNLGIAFAKPEIPAPAKSRSNLGLRSDAVVYLVSQMLSKILPNQDRVFAAIAQQVPNAQFVFIARPNAAIAAQFQHRLESAFAEVGLDSDRHCLMLPPQSQADFWNLNQVCDVFLDSFGWSGGHTTLEAIACDLPIVTLPGEFMRGRHSAAILQMLGLTETIATSEAEYVAIAVHLGLDSVGRTQLVEQMRDRHSHLYDDKTCVRAMEAFYQTVVAEFSETASSDRGKQINFSQESL